MSRRTGWRSWSGLAGGLSLALSVSACGGGYYSAASPPSTSSSGASSSTSSSADSFDEDRARIRSTVPGWDEGTGATVRFLKEASGTRTSLIFVDPTAPAWSSDLDLWVIEAKAKGSDDSILGHLMIGLAKLEPGTYEGSPSSKQSVMSVRLVEPQYDGKAPDTTWSVNDGSWCRVVLRDAGNGTLEGDFQAKLVDNKNEQYVTVESGYLLIKRR